jgi:putative ABC transport system permease protein
MLESFRFAIHSVIINKLRTMLSLLGITIGIFAIISVFTIVDSLEFNIRESVSALGSDIIYVDKWPWVEEDGQDYKWWQYRNRPVTRFMEYEQIRSRSSRAQSVCFVTATRSAVQYEKNRNENTVIMAVSEAFEHIRSFEMLQGRYFSDFEVRAGRNLAVMGNTVATNLFRNVDPVGKSVSIRGNRYRIVGVIKKEGKSSFGNSLDETIILPVNQIRNHMDIRSESMNPSIWIKAVPGLSMDELKAEVRMIMRLTRRLKPDENDNFSLNQTSLISNQLDKFFKTLNFAGWFIGIFSLLVGGFGIANIMFVSVKERTNMIGIQKALGAKKFFILYQFLFEAIMLAIAGGAIGLLFVFLVTLLISQSEFIITMRVGNIISGIMISSFIGLISGLAPAWSASRLNPVEAINVSF